jgi:hypothetical protein
VKKRAAKSKTRAKTRPARKTAKPVRAGAKAIVAAQVRVLCVNGTINHAIIGYGKNCTEAYKDADVKARLWCYKHGGTQKITKVKCPAV